MEAYVDTPTSEEVALIENAIITPVVLDPTIDM